MSTKVLHGEGKPRIVISETAIYSGTISSRSGYDVVLSGTPTLTSDVIGRMLATYNASDEVTLGKIIDYDDSTDTVTCSDFSNLFPASGKNATIQDKVIDLPFCETLGEWLDIKMKPPKTLYHNRKKVRQIEGFYYNCALSYERFADLDLISSMQDVYDSTRTAEFTFYPRRDNMSVNYLCEVSGENPFEFAQLPFHQGHKNVIFYFEGLELLTKAPFTSSLLNAVGNTVTADNTFVVDI